MSALALHGVTTSIMGWAWSAMKLTPHDHIVSQETGGRYQFLTIQTLFLARIYMAVSVVCDLFPSVLEFASTIKKMLLMIALPTSCTVTIVYWSLYLFFPELILRFEEPQETQEGKSTSSPARLPLHLDMSMHLVPFVTLFVDFLAFEDRFSKEQLQNVAPRFLVICGLWYSCWMEYCAKYNGLFPYPFLTRSPFQGRVVLYFCVTATAFTALMVLNYLHS